MILATALVLGQLAAARPAVTPAPLLVPWPGPTPTRTRTPTPRPTLASTRTATPTVTRTPGRTRVPFTPLPAKTPTWGIALDGGVRLLEARGVGPAQRLTLRMDDGPARAAVYSATAKAFVCESTGEPVCVRLGSSVQVCAGNPAGPACFSFSVPVPTPFDVR